MGKEGEGARWALNKVWGEGPDMTDEHTYLEPLEQEPALAVGHVSIFTEWFVEQSKAWVTANL